MHPQNPQYNNNPGLGFNSGSGPQYPQGSSLYPQQPNYGQVFIKFLFCSFTLIKILNEIKNGTDCLFQTPHQGPYPQIPNPNSQGYNNPTPSSKSGFLDQAGMALAGVLGPGLLAKGVS